MTGPTLFELQPIFDGPGIEPCDLKPLAGQLLAVYDLMLDGEYRSLRTIADAIGCASEAGVSARLRDLRKARNGAHTIVRRRIEQERRTYEYKLIPRGTQP